MSTNQATGSALQRLHTSAFDDAEATLQARRDAHRRKREAAGVGLVLAEEPDGIPAHLTRWCSSSERAEEFLDFALAMELDGQRFWRMVADAWASFDLIPHDDCAGFFRWYRAEWSPSCMSCEDRAEYDALPGVLTLYRGQSASAPIGLAWTLQRDVAEGLRARASRYSGGRAGCAACESP